MSGSPTPLPRTLVIIPAFNEAGSIAQVVSQLRRNLPDVDVVVVDDGSTDGTARHVPFGATVLRLPFNLGIGGAMQAGYRYAARHGYTYALQVDADGQHPPEFVSLLRETIHASGANMVIGSRFLEKTSYQAPPSRRAGMLMLAGLIRLLSGKRYTDVTSGYRIVGPKVIRCFAHWYPDDYPEPEVILLLSRAGFRIEEVSVEMLARQAGVSSISFSKGFFYVIKVAAALLLGMFRQPWPPALWEDVQR